MSTIQDVRGQAAHNHLFDVLTDDTRRRIVTILRQRAGPLSEELLAERLVADSPSPDGDGVDVQGDGDAVSRLRVRLRHVHLPKLEASGLVAWDQEEGTVAESNHPSLDIGSLDALMAVGDDQGSIAAALSDERRRTIVTVVIDAEGDLDRNALARTLAAGDADGEPSESAVREAATQLHHRHLPQLEAAGLIEYDTEAATVTYDGPAALPTLLPVIE